MPTRDGTPALALDHYGPWKVERWIGRGGYGDVAVARDDRGVTAAIKVYSRQPDAVRDRGAEAAILDELKACPTVPRLLGQGTEAPARGLFGDSIPWLAMEYIPGQRLTDLLPLSRTEARRMVADVGDALRCAHEAGIVHGDVKPDNVIRAPDGRYVLVDWGLASPPGDPSGQYKGTPGFVAPEKLDPDQFGGYDGRADVYGLAALYYAALIGQSPFWADTPVRMLRRQLGDDRANTEALREGHDGEAVYAALSARPEERTPTVDAFLSQLGAPVNASPEYSVTDYDIVPSFRVAAQAVALFPAADARQWRERFETQPIGFTSSALATPEARLPQLFRDPLAAVLASWLVEAQRTPARAASALTEYARRASGQTSAQGALALEAGPPPSPTELRRQTLGSVAAVGGTDPAEVARIGIARWLAGHTR